MLGGKFCEAYLGDVEAALAKRSGVKALDLKSMKGGGSPMTAHIARKVVHSFQARGASPQPMENLAVREREVLDLLAQGLMYKEIADKLGIGFETVRTYVRRIYEKLQVRSRTEAVAKALRR